MEHEEHTHHHDHAHVHHHAHSHGKAHGHSHGHHHHAIDGKNLAISVALNAIITIAEFVGGILSNSLLLVSDAVHNLSDTLALALSFVAHRIGKRKSTTVKSYGFKRFEILAAFVNSLALIVISIYLIYASYQRIAHPEPIHSKLMFTIALIGFFGNLFSILLLKKDSDHNLNIRSAYLHLLGDTLSSVAVIVGAIVIYYYNITWIDAVLTMAISLTIVWHTWKVLKETIDILMQSMPHDFDINAMKTEVESIDGVANIHHVHAWQLNDEKNYLECHVDLSRNMLVSESEEIKSKIQHILMHHHGFSHTTIQMEFNCCEKKDLVY